MKKAIYDTLVSKIATLEPWFAKAIVDGAIERAGHADYRSVSPVETLHLIKADIQPRIAKRLPSYQSVLTMGAGLLITNHRDRIVHSNAIMRRLLDSIFEAHDISRPRSSGSRIYQSDDTFELLRSLGLMRRAAQVTDIEVRQVRCDPIGRVLSLSIAPLRGAELQKLESVGPGGLCCVYQDMTLSEDIEASLEDFFAELQQSNSLLAESEERYKNIVEHTGDLIMMTEPDGAISYLSMACEEVIGHPRAAVLRDFTGLAHPDDRELLQQMCLAALRGDEPKGCEVRFITRDGEVRWLSQSFTPIWRDGGVHQVVSVIRDTTARRRSEEEMVRAYQISEAASVAKSRFLANVSHEIRTPMNAVLGLVGLLLDMDLRAQEREYATLAKRAAESLLALINDILDVSKIEAGRLEIDSREFGLESLLEDLRRLINVRISSKDVVFSLELDPDVPARLRGDSGRLRQILTNLLENAVKFTERGRISLHVALEREDPSYAVLRFVVADTGVGIPTDCVDTVFELFTQVDGDEPQRQCGGTGLGLAISRQLAEMMGGTVRLESRVGVGSRFWVTLPFEKTEADRELRIESGSGLVAQASIGDGAALDVEIRILVAEDNLVNQTVALGMLRKLGLGAALVQNGSEAIEALASEPYDLVFMDVQMPGMDGLEATRRIRDGGVGAVNQNVPIVAMTAHAMKGDRERCLASGMNDYLSKPVSLEDLAAVITRWVLGPAQSG